MGSCSIFLGCFVKLSRRQFNEPVINNLILHLIVLVKSRNNEVGSMPSGKHFLTSLSFECFIFLNTYQFYYIYFSIFSETEVFDVLLHIPTHALKT